MRWPWVSRRAYDVVFDQCLANEREMKLTDDAFKAAVAEFSRERYEIRKHHASLVRDILQATTNERPVDPVELMGDPPEPPTPLPPVIAQALLDVGALPNTKLFREQETIIRDLMIANYSETDIADLVRNGIEIEL